MFGENWEPRLAEFLAFLRRRVTGDYAVDEYGFDPEVTERFFLSAIRPIKEKWFRVEVRGRGEHSRPRVARCWSRTTPAPSRWMA